MSASITGGRALPDCHIVGAPNRDKGGTGTRLPNNPSVMSTGPVGPLARVVLVSVAIASFVSIANQGGPASFRGSRNLLEPSLLLLDTVMVVLFVHLVGVTATLVGIPGCEIGVWPYLVSRLRGERPPLNPVGCVVGLHLIDE